jgi:hypothetical protein
VDNPVIPFPVDPDGATDADELAVVEIDAAIAMVVGGHADRVRLTALPFVDRVAGIGAAHAHTAGVSFRVERAERAGVLTVTVGPRE